MKHYYSGQYYNIQSRLKRKDRCFNELVCLQFRVKRNLEELPGWRPMPKEEFWPICPSVGDSFMMESYWSSPEEDEDGSKSEYKTWVVVSRDILPSGPNASEMNGIVLLTVDMEETDELEPSK